MTRTTIALVAVTASLSPLFAQEKPVPKDSLRLSISGCAHGRVFTVGRDPNHESRGYELEEGMKLRLEGPKDVLNEIKKNEHLMVDIVGIMKQSEAVQPGVGLAGGRVRVTPVMPAGRSTAGSPGPRVPVVDVESVRLLTSSCPKR
jgi:hypothetical protein